MRILTSLRAVYLYSVLSIAVGAIGIAAVALLSLAFELGGMAAEPPSATTIRERISVAAAILIFAVPVGAVHLWLVARSLRDPGERTSGPRHLFLNAWIVVGLVIVFFSIVGMAAMTIAFRSGEFAMELATFTVGALVALAGWRWREATPGARRLWQLLGAFATLSIATVFGAIQLMPLMSALSGMAAGRSTTFFYAGHGSSDQGSVAVALAALVGLIAALGMWWIGLRWQWPWRDVTFRTIHASAGLLTGLLFLALPGTDEVARLIAAARGSYELTVLTRFWAEPAIGLYLVALHLPWLLADRGRIAFPARVTDRLVRGIAALAGLAALAIAWWASWSYLAQDVLHVGPAAPVASPTNIAAGDEAVAGIVVGLALYVPAWLAFQRSTRGEPASGLRRAYVLTVVSLALLGMIVTGVMAAANAISLALGAPATDPLVRTTIDVAGLAVGFAVLLAAHLWLLLGDLRAARTSAPVVATVRPRAPDPLVALLEDVAAGKISPEEGATRIRAGSADRSPAGRTA